jgi:lipopolysaccharide/colanic/teichoic acid biosynthesis glycosyltransferase
MSTPDTLAEIDGRYVETQTLSGDLMIIAKTVFGGGSGDAATRSF